MVRWSSVQEVTETGILASVATPRKMGVEDMVQCGDGCSGPLSERTLKPEPILHLATTTAFRVQELCESRGGRPGLSVLTSLAVSVDVKQH